MILAANTVKSVATPEGQARGGTDPASQVQDPEERWWGTIRLNAHGLIECGVDSSLLFGERHLLAPAQQEFEEQTVEFPMSTILKH
jgi:hypothetical protein